MRVDRRRLAGVWRQVLGLSWPVMVEQVSRTLMRTTDIFVTALFSPLAVAAIGLADLYARFPLRIGLGLGAGAIALSSQDTGSGATGTRDEAITQALLVGALAGIPILVFGLTLSEEAIRILGFWADRDEMDEVARLGGVYLAIIFATSPARHVALIGARSLQGTGDTRTPMYVNLASNGLNIALSLVLGLGLLGAPRLEIVGVGIATAVGNVFTAVYGLTAPFTVLYVTLSGSLQGGSDTRTPFLARTTGLVGFYLGFSALTSVALGWGVVGVYAGIMLYYVWSFLVVAAGFRYGGWADRAAAMMAERGSAADD